LDSRRSAPLRGLFSDMFPATSSRFRHHELVHHRLLVRAVQTACPRRPCSGGAALAWSPATSRRREGRVPRHVRNFD
jgi:hypothetical protein